MMILFWLLIGLAVYYFVKNNGQADNKNKNHNAAADVLKLRYVNGEIDQETYKRTLDVLNEGRR